MEIGSVRAAGRFVRSAMELVRCSGPELVAGAVVEAGGGGLGPVGVTSLDLSALGCVSSVACGAISVGGLPRAARASVAWPRFCGRGPMLDRAGGLLALSLFSARSL